MAINIIPNDSLDCATQLLYPAIPADPACTTFQLRKAEISDVWILAQQADGTFPTNPFTWGADENSLVIDPDGIDNLQLDNSKMMWLKVVGSIDTPDKEQEIIFDGKTKNGLRTFTLAFTDMNLDGGKYQFYKRLQLNPTNYRFYYKIRGGWVYGIDGGLEPCFSDCDFPKGTGDAKDQANATIQFEAYVDPDRREYPL